MEQAELDWRQYQLNVDLYRGYLEIVLKINGFYYAVTGAIVSYFIAHQGDSFMRWSLLLPLLMSIALAIFFALGGRAALVQRDEIFALRKKLGFQAAPEVGFLVLLLAISGILMMIVAGGLVWLTWFR